MLSFGGCLKEPKPILRYALDECLNVWIKEDWENLELYHMNKNATENNYEIKVFVTVKTCSSFLNYVTSKSLYIALKVSSRERRRVVLLMESVQISPCGFICEHEESRC